MWEAANRARIQPPPREQTASWGIADPDRLLAATLYVALLATTLIFVPGLNEGFELPKQIALRAIAAGALVYAIIAAARGGQTSLRLIVTAPAALCALAVVVVWVCATVTSVSPLASFWGSYQRWTGLVTQVAFLLLFLMSAAVLGTTPRATRLAEIVAIAGSLAAVYALIQRAGLDPLSWNRGVEWSGQSISSADRPFGTFGNPDFLAAFLAISIVLTAGLLLRRKQPLSFRAGMWWISAAVQIAALLLTGSRAGLLGCVAGLALYALMQSEPRRLLRQRWAPPAVAVLILAVFIAATVPNLGSINRLLSFDPGDGSTRVRLALWNASIQLIAERPVTGWGLDTFGKVVLQHYPAALWYLEPPEFIVDRAHNAIVDALVSMGVIGAIAYGIVAGGLVRHIWKTWRVGVDRQARSTTAGLTAALAAHLVEQQFNVEVTAASALAWIIAGSILGLSSSTVRTPPTLRLWQTRSGWQSIVASFSVAIVLAIIGSRQIVADHAYAGAIAAERGGATTTAISDLRSAVDSWGPEPTYWHELGRAYLAYARNGTVSAYRDAVAAADEAVRLDPGNPLVLSNWAVIAGEAAAQLNDAALAARAREAHALATERARGHWLVWRSAGATAFNQRDYVTARGDFTRSTELFASDAPTWSSLGDTEAALGNIDAARAAYLNAINLVPTDQQALAGLRRLPVR